MSLDIRACRPDDLDPLLPLLDEEFIFSKGRSISLRLRFSSVYCRNNSHNIIICTDGKEIVAALAMHQFNWREGGKIFRGAMIGAVYALPTRRREGLASRLLASAATQLRKDGVDFGVLWTGKPSFYARLGWVGADCGVLGEANPNGSMPEQLGTVALLPVEANTSQLESLRQNQLNAMTLRHPEDYRQLPLPADRVDVLWSENQGKVAYALLGSRGETGFLYELVGDAACFPALWQEACRSLKQVFINDKIDSPSFCWLTEHALSERVDIDLLGQWHIPYFDRI